MISRFLFTITTVLALSACNVDLGGETDNSPHDEPNQRRLPQGTVFGDQGIFTTEKGTPEDGSGGGIGVNDLLWRASLDTVSFMPLISADPFGGVIITDWYSPPQTPEERFKVNIYILGRALRADGVRATVFPPAKSRWAMDRCPGGTQYKYEYGKCDLDQG